MKRTMRRQLVKKRHAEEKDVLEGRKKRRLQRKEEAGRHEGIRHLCKSFV